MPVELLPHLRRARDVADRNYAEPLDLAALAAAAGVSKYHFLRCFAAAYGETPMQYVTRRRIERATDLLRATNLTVTEVCGMVGYSSLGSFSQRFTELVGMTPTQYQRTQTGARIPGCFVCTTPTTRSWSCSLRCRGRRWTRKQPRRSSG